MRLSGRMSALHEPMKKIHIISLGLVALAGALSMAGCSTDENPITPDKMQEIRKQEADQRANFKPGGGTPPQSQAPR